MSYNTSDINKLKQQIKQYYSFIKNDGMILTNFAKYLLSKADMNLEQAIINLKDMSIKDIQNKLYDLTLELNTGNEISDIIKIKIDEENKKALVKVPEDQLSLAIGKSGQNVRLAAKLTGWNVDIDGADDSGIEQAAKEIEDQPAKPKRTADLEDALLAATTDGSDEKPTDQTEVVEKEEKLEDTEDK